MMKKYTHSVVSGSIWLLVSVLLLQFNLTAQVTQNYIIVSGQVINSEFGNVVKNHSVFFLKDSTVMIDSGPLLTEVVTDDEGFYYDTIPTRTSKGTLQIYTKNFFGFTTDTLKHYRFVTYTNSNIIVTNFDIYMPIQVELLQSRFTYLQKQTGDPYRFRFVDQTNHTEILSWDWTFGDGTTSDQQHPDHVFPGPGMYKIRLTTKAMIEEIEQENTMLRVIYIADRSFFHLGGHAYAGYFPANQCTANLYYIDSNDITIPVDTVSLDTLGYYYFWQVPTGNYYVKVQPKKTSDLYGFMMPTYFGDVVFWEDATQISHEFTYWGYHVNFIEATGIDTGEGDISGNVKYIEISEGNDYDLPAKGIDIYVMDEDNQTLVSHYSDEYGVFEFPEVALGTYWLFPEVTGLNQKKYKVEVTPEEPVVANIEIILSPDNSDSTDFINDFVAENSLGFPYPNPATDLIHLTVQAKGYSQATIDLFDLQGRKLVSQPLQIQGGSNTMTIQLSGYKAGIYFVRANIDGVISEQRFVVAR